VTAVTAAMPLIADAGAATSREVLRSGRSTRALDAFLDPRICGTYRDITAPSTQTWAALPSVVAKYRARGARYFATPSAEERCLAGGPGGLNVIDAVIRLDTNPSRARSAAVGIANGYGVLSAI